MSFCHLTKGITSKICRLCVYVIINKRCFEFKQKKVGTHDEEGMEREGNIILKLFLKQGKNKTNTAREITTNDKTRQAQESKLFTDENN